MFIYCITNKINGKRYIGQTIMSVEKRWMKHRSKTGGCPLLANAIKSYGANAFDIKILCRATSMAELNDRESFCIRIFKTMHPLGYNLQSGGGAGRRVSEETKLKISQSSKGRKIGPISEELRRKRSAARIGRRLPHATKQKLSENMLGKKKSASHCKAISAAKTGSGHHLFGVFGKENKLSKPIVWLNYGRIFYGISEASRETGLSTSSIVAILKGRRLSYLGNVFEYLNEDNGEYSSRRRAIEYRKSLKNDISDKKIVCIETGNTYASYVDAASSLRLSKGNIHHVLFGRRKSTGGFRFKFIEDFI